MVDGIRSMDDGRTDHQPYAISRQPLAIDVDRNRATAPLGDLGDRHPQFAVDEGRARAGGVARAPEADDAREAAVAALHEMETRLAARPPGGFLAGNQDAVAL